MNPYSKPIPVVLDKPRNLLYTSYSLYWLSQHYEDPKEPFRVIGELSASGDKIVLTVDVQRKFFDLLVAGLIHEDEGLTAEKLMKSMPLNGMTEALNGFAVALAEQFTQKKEGEETENPQ